MSTDMEQLVARLDNEFDYLCNIGKVPITPPKVSESHLIGNCAGCARDLPWPTPRSGFWAAPVPCPQCGRVYFTEARNHSSVKLDQPGSVPTTTTVTALQDIASGDANSAGAEIVSEFFGADCVTHERRRSIRYALSAPVVVVPLDSEGRPIAEAYDMTLLNISTGGVGLMRTGEAIGERLVIDFAIAGYPGVQAVGEVRWRSEAYGVTKLGCEFVHPLTE